MKGFMDLSEVVDTVATHLPAVWVVGAITLGGATLTSLDSWPQANGPSPDTPLTILNPQPTPAATAIIEPVINGKVTETTNTVPTIQLDQPQGGRTEGASVGDTALVEATASKPRQLPLELGTVERIIDGDTYEIRLDRTNGLARVRLAWLDAPEQAQPYGMEATTWAKAALLGKRVVLTVQETDPYGRLVSQLNVASVDQMWDVGATLARMGLAWLDPRFSEGREGLREDQVLAKGEGIGLWSQPNPLPPWDWRRNRPENNQN